jgi:hypothetical protein
VIAPTEQKPDPNTSKRESHLPQTLSPNDPDLGFYRLFPCSTV